VKPSGGTVNRRFVCFICSVFLLCGAVSANAAGFAVYEFSARGNALGGAMVARDADVSSQAFNPALLTQLTKPQVLAGVTAVRPSASVVLDGYGKIEGESSTWLIPHAYGSMPLSDSVTLGIGTFSRFGLGTAYDENWAGRADITKVGITSFSVNPVLGIKLTDTLSIGGGVEMMWFDFEQEKRPNISPTTIVDAKVGGDSVAPGVNLGVHYKPFDWLSLGASWRSIVKHKLKGQVQLEQNIPGFPTTGATGSVTLPEQYAFGVAVSPIENLSIEAGAMYIGWSSYKRLRIEYDERFGASTVSNKNTKYKDVWRYNVGIEYGVNDDWTLRVGYVYDNSPLNDDHLDFLVPANDRQMYSLGVGWSPGDWTVDVSYNYLDIKERRGSVKTSQLGERDVTFTDGDAHLVGVSVGYTF